MQSSLLKVYDEAQPLTEMRLREQQGKNDMRIKSLERATSVLTVQLENDRSAHSLTKFEMRADFEDDTQELEYIYKKSLALEARYYCKLGSDGRADHQLTYHMRSQR